MDAIFITLLLLLQLKIIIIKLKEKLLTSALFLWYNIIKETEERKLIMNKIKKFLGIYNENDMKQFKKDIKDAVIL